jgi:hypothetical protein
MKCFVTYIFFSISSIFYSQCNYKTITQNGIILKQFYPMPIGGDNSKQIAVSISNIAGKSNLSITIRFLEKRTEIEKDIKLNLFENNVLNIKAERIGNDIVGGNQITHMIFSLDEISTQKLINHRILSIVINKQDTIVAKLNSSYISENLNCLN